MIIVDTNVLSETSRAQRNLHAVRWLTEKIDEVFVPTVVISEIRYGCAKLPQSRNRAALEQWLGDLISIYSKRLVPLDLAVAEAHGILRAQLKKIGKPMNATDGMIAATALAFDAPVATRNVDDFRDCGVQVINPWNT